MMGLYIAYYILSIAASVGCWYFRRFKVRDYQYNKNLRIKRRFMIIFTYLVCLLHVQLVAGHEILFYPVENPWIISSAFIFILVNTFFLGFVEIPRRH